jgi:hypothetical protein
MSGCISQKLEFHPKLGYFHSNRIAELLKYCLLQTMNKGKGTTLRVQIELDIRSYKEDGKHVTPPC